MEVLGIILGSTVIASIMNFFLDMLRKKLSKKDSLHMAVCVLLKEKLREKAVFFRDRGYITPAELQEWEEAYVIYHDKLAGNGWLKENRAILYSLPSKEVDKK